MQRISTALSGY